MLTEVKNQLKIMFLSIKYNLTREMLNKVTFLTNIVFMILNNAAFIVQWIVLYGIKDNIGGYGLNDVILLWALASGTYSVCFIFFAGCQSLPNLIMNGKMDSFIVQPKNILLSAITSKTKISAIGDLIYAYILFFIYGFTIKGFILFTIFIILGGLIVTAVGVICGSLAFYITRADTLTGTITGTILSFDTYPEGIFKGFVKILFYTIIPIGFVAYIPKNLLNDFNIYGFLLLILVTILFIVLAFIVFYKGLKKYSSTNLMISRI